MPGKKKIKAFKNGRKKIFCKYLPQMRGLLEYRNSHVAIPQLLIIAQKRGENYER
jgi:hypothetical protein